MVRDSENSRPEKEKHAFGQGDSIGMEAVTKIPGSFAQWEQHCSGGPVYVNNNASWHQQSPS